MIKSRQNIKYLEKKPLSKNLWQHLKEIKTEYKEIDEAIQNLSEPINRLKDQFEQNSETKTKVDEMPFFNKIYLI